MKTVISKRFKSVFVASIASMAISYVLMLTDNVVAGQFVGEEAVAAMTLVAPLMMLMFFISYMVADGLAMMFAYAKGNNDRVKANELFGMGVICSVVSGVLLTVILVVFEHEILSLWKISPELMSYADEYYRGLMFIALPCILNIYFYTIYVAEGEENICVQAAAAMFVVNMILDIALGYYVGVIGIGIATVVGNLVSFLYHIPYLFSKKCQLRLVKYWNLKELWQGICYSWYHSIDTLYLAILPLIFSTFVLEFYDEEQLIVVTVIMNMLALLFSIYTGIVDCIQPMVCQYHMEKAIKSVQKTMRLGIGSTIAVTVAVILFSFVFAEFLPGLLGVEETDVLYADSVFAVRIFMPFTIFLGITLMLSNYYIYIERLNLGAAIKTLLLIVFPSLGMFLGVYGLHYMFLGVGLSFIISFAINVAWTRRNVLLINKKEFLAQFCFDTENRIENLPELRNTLAKYNVDEKSLVEEIFKEYCTREEKFQIEITVTAEQIIFRENSSGTEPRFDKDLQKSYMISGDENKFVVTLQG